MASWQVVESVLVMVVHLDDETAETMAGGMVDK